MRSGVDGVGAVIETRVGRDARTQLHQRAALVEVHVDGPRGLAGVIEHARVQFERLLRHLGDGLVVVAFGDHAQAIAGGALRERRHQLLGER